MTIGQLAAAAGLSAGTIRYYEQVGLLSPTRTPAGYRQYPRDVIRRLMVIRSAQQFGFSLREIALFLRDRDAGGRPCQNVRDAASRMLAAVDAQISELEARRRQMRDTLQRWDETLAETPADKPARLLETLIEQPRSQTRHPCRSW